MAKPHVAEEESPIDEVSNSVLRVFAQQHADPFEHYAVRRVRLASLTIHCIESDPVTVSRRSEDILEDHVFDVLLHVQLDGVAEFIQGEQTFTLSENAIAIVPGGIPYSVRYPERGRKIILRIPHRVFHERVMGREVRDFCAVVLDRGGMVPVVVNLVKSLTLEESGDLSEIEQHTLADSFLALVGALVRSRAKQGAIDCSKNQSARLSRILSYLEEHFDDHELTPKKIADANFVSVRHLHGLFKQCGTTVSRWIWDRRLRAGREDLLDATMGRLTICEIAYRRGFNDSAHFSRAFKERFGIPPGQLRLKSRSGDSDVD